MLSRAALSAFVVSSTAAVGLHVAGLTASGESARLAVLAAWSAAGLGATVAITAAAVGIPKGRIRLAWVLWAAATGLWLAGALIRFVDSSAPSSADALWLSFAGLSLAGMAFRLPSGLSSLGLFALDALPVVVAVATLAWVTDPHPDSGLAHHVGDLLYPSLYVFLALLAAQLVLLQGVRYSLRHATIVFPAGFGCLAAAALFWSQPALETGRATGRWTDSLWSAGLLLIGGWAAHRTRAPAGSTKYRAPRPEGGARALPGAAAIFGLIVLDIATTPRSEDLIMVALFAAVAAFALRSYLVRQALRRLVRELRRERDFTSAVLETAGALVYVVDRQHRLVRFNRACEELSGYTRDEVLGRTTHELSLVPAEEAGEVGARLSRVRAGEFPNGGENYWVTRKGERRLISWKNTALLDETGAVAYVSTGIDITDQRQAEEALAEREAELRTLISNIPGAVYRCDYELPWRTHFASPYIEVLSGYPRDEFTGGGRRFVDFMHPDDVAAVDVATRAAVEAGEPYVIRYRTIHTDGTERWISDHGRAVYGHDGRVLWLDGVLLDITELKQAEERLHAAEAKYRTLIEGLPLATYVNAPDEHVPVVYMSPQIEPLIGYTVEEQQSDPDFFPKVLHADDRERVLAEHAHSFATGEPLRTEYRVVAKDGRVVWFQDEGVIKRDAAGTPCLHGFLLDITEEQEAAERLYEAEARYRNLVEQLPAVIYTATIDADVERSPAAYVSPQIEALTGVSSEEWLSEGRHWIETLHPEDRERVISEASRARAEGKPWQSEHRVVARDGRVVWVRDATSVVHDAAGRPAYVQGIVIDITEQKRAEEEFRLAESKYRLLVEQLPAIVYAAEAGVHARWHYVSPQIESILGFTPDEWTQDSTLWAEQIHPEDRERVHAAEAEQVETGAEPRLEYRLIGQDGRVVWVHDKAVLIRDGSGAPPCFHGFLLDITEQKRVEGELRRSEETFRSYFENSSIGMALTAPDGRFLRVNPALCEIVGYPADELVGLPFRDLTHPDDLEQNLELIRALLEGVTPSVHFEKRYIHKSGRVVWVLVTSSVLRDPGGEPLMMVTQIQDITERKQAEDRLRETTEMLEALIENSPVPIVAFDREGCVSLWNPAAEQAFGWAAEEVLGRPNPLVREDQMEEFLGRLRLGLRGKSWRDADRVCHRKDGSTIHVRVSSAPLRDAGGDIVGMVSIVADVTKQKLAEAEREELLVILSEQNEQLRELDRLKDEFVALVSHELRTPLTSIRGYLELVLEGDAGELTPEQAAFLEVVDRNSERLLRLVGDLLLIAQLEAGAMRLVLTEVDLAALAAECVQGAAPAAEKKGVELALELDSVPPIQGDRARLGQVLDNFLSNAIKFTPTGGRVTARVLGSEEGVVVEVSDTGIGIPKDEQERLFERFFRTADATKQAIQGTGLGLAITKGIIEAHGGAISVESAEGAGTTFRIVLPAAKDEGAIADNTAEELAR